MEISTDIMNSDKKGANLGSDKKQSGENSNAAGKKINNGDVPASPASYYTDFWLVLHSVHCSF